MKKKTTVIGLRLRCTSCGKIFIIGSKGVDAAKERAYKHMFEHRCSCEFIPVNPPKGLTYIGENGQPEVVFSGDDFESYWKEVKAVAFTNRTSMSPKLELTI